jgi:hypothetical protein
MSRPTPFEQLRELLSGLDEALPGLASALDPSVVVRRLSQRQLGPGPTTSISACALQHIRWSPGVECSATYKLTLESPSAESGSTIGVVNVTPHGVHDRLWHEDVNLPGLVAATDPLVMARWLSECLGRPVDSCSVTLVRYRANNRCVLRYELQNGSDAVLYGKVIAGDGVAVLASTISGLGDTLVAPVVGIAPEWQLVVQADAGQRSLRSVAGGTPSHQELAQLRASGQLLSALHARSGPPGMHRSLAEDADELVQHLPACKRVSPATAELLAAGIERVQALAPPAGPAGPSHGAFRLDQVHLTDAGPLLIDLDSYCWADPARDVANLFGYLRWRGIRQPDATEALARIREAFLDGYGAEAAAALDEERLRAFEAASLLKIAGRRYRRLAVKEWDMVPKLIETALDRIGGGPDPG